FLNIQSAQKSALIPKNLRKRLSKILKLPVINLIIVVHKTQAMNRKHFLSVLTIAGLTSNGFNNTWANTHTEIGKESRIPPYIKQGDTIGITSPAGYITLEQIRPAVQLMESWGFKVQIGSSIGKRDYSMGGTDAERTADLQQMMDNPNIQAI